MESKLKELFCEVKNDPTLFERIGDETDIINEVGLDSLQMIHLIMRVEEEFNVEIDFEEFNMEYLRSVSRFSAYLKSKV